MESTADRYDFRVRWEPFLLRPGMPPEGVKKPDGHNKGPGTDRLKQAGAAVGIDFTSKCDRYPSTIQAHALLEYAKDFDGGAKQNEVAELLFKSYFTDGNYPDVKHLLQVAAQVGLDTGKVKEYITAESNIERAHERAKNWTRQGVTGVPCFFMNGQRTFSGAQEPDTFVKVFDRVMNMKITLNDKPVDKNTAKSS